MHQTKGSSILSLTAANHWRALEEAKRLDIFALYIPSLQQPAAQGFNKTEVKLCIYCQDKLNKRRTVLNEKVSLEN